jgi:hypothetical protein
MQIVETRNALWRTAEIVENQHLLITPSQSTTLDLMAEPSAAASEVNALIMDLPIISKITHIADTDTALMSENVDQEMAVTQ